MGQKYFKVAICPLCDNEFDFILSRQILDAYESNNHKGVINFRRQKKTTLPYNLVFHYYILRNRIDVLVKEEGTDHCVFIRLGNKSREIPFEILAVYGIEDDVLSDYLSKKMGLEILPEDLPKVFSAIMWDDFLTQHLSASVSIEA